MRNLKEPKWHEWIVFPANAILAVVLCINSSGEMFGFLETSSPFLPDYILMMIIPNSIVLLAQLCALAGIVLLLFEKKISWFFLHTGAWTNLLLLLLLLRKTSTETGAPEPGMILSFLIPLLVYASLLILLYMPAYRKKNPSAQTGVWLSYITILLLVLITGFSYELSIQLSSFKIEN